MTSQEVPHGYYIPASDGTLGYRNFDDAFSQEETPTKKQPMPVLPEKQKDTAQSQRKPLFHLLPFRRQ